MGSVSEASLGDVADLTLVLIYIVVATVLVSVPAGIVIIAGERAAAIVESVQAWLTTHARELRLWLSLGIGAALIVDALLRLLA